MERVQVQGARRQTGEVAKPSQLGRRVVRILRPTQDLQESARIEDAATLSLGPVGLHQAHQMHVIKFAEPRGHRIHEVDAGLIARGRKGLALHLVSNGSHQFVGFPMAIIVALVRIRQRVERAEYRRAGA